MVNDCFHMDFERFTELSNAKLENGTVSSRKLIIVTCTILCHLSQEWTKLKRLEGVIWPVERDSHAACCLNYGEEHPQLLVTGGLDNDGNTLSDAWILDVNSGRWSEVNDSTTGVCM